MARRDVESLQNASIIYIRGLLDENEVFEGYLIQLLLYDQLFQLNQSGEWLWYKYECLLAERP